MNNQVIYSDNTVNCEESQFRIANIGRSSRLFCTEASSPLLATPHSAYTAALIRRRESDLPDNDPPPLTFVEAEDAPPIADQHLRWSQVVLSALSAGLGIQSQARRERDFENGSSSRFIVVGVTLTALLVLTLCLIVRTILD